MTIEPGTRLGHYEVVEAIGAGGMGEVYRARDTKLHREVAIKILSTKIAPVPERLARFEREAHLLASLIHPNIATIHGLEKDRGIDFIVLELVEGETLAERIARGPIPLDEALLLFDQVAHGLEAAHEKGIIHRDLKPPNVKITPDGHVKILDFGLGKVFEAPEAGQVDLSQSPTLTRGGTRAGVILGTAAYMSPEQARSEAVDKRTDIWAFGCCLYEALTGKPVFSGKSVVDTLASVVRVEPDWERLPAGTPFLVRRVLERSLDKDARSRFHDIADARMDLEDAPSAIVTTTKPAGSSFLHLVLLAILLFGFGALLLWLRAAPGPVQPVTKVEIETGPLHVSNRTVAFSRDGTKIAYVANDRQIYVRYMDRDAVIALPNTRGGRLPCFSPDGEWVAFHHAASGKLKKTPVNGGAAVTLADWTFGASFGLDWELDGEIFFADSDAVYRISANGGERERLEVAKSESEVVANFPRWPDALPGGDTILLTVGDFPQGQATVLHDVKSGERRVLIDNAVFARYVPTGHIVFLRDDALYAVRFDLDNLALGGEAVPVLENIETSVQNGSVQYAFSDAGSLAYILGDWDGFRRKLVWVDREGKVETIRSIPERIVGPRLLPDGEGIALTRYDKTRPGVWLTEISRETMRPLFRGKWAVSAAWSPSGEQIAFEGMSRAGRTVFLTSFEGDDKVQVLGPGGEPTWSADGTRIAYHRFEPGTMVDIWMVSLEGDRTPKPFLNGPLLEGRSVFSPDGKWLAYVSNESGNARVYVRPVDGSGGKHQISTEFAMGPLWAPDGKEIFYRSQEAVMAVEVQMHPSFRASTPQTLFRDEFRWHDINGWYRNYDISPDGKRFLMIQSEEEPPPPTKIKIVLNWFEELKRLVPVD